MPFIPRIDPNKIMRHRRLFEMWRIWVSIKTLGRLVYRLPMALLTTNGLRRYARADDVFKRNGEYYIEWLRDGMSFHGKKMSVIRALIRKDIHDSWWFIRRSLRNLIGST